MDNEELQNIAHRLRSEFNEDNPKFSLNFDPVTDDIFAQASKESALLWVADWLEVAIKLDAESTEEVGFDYGQKYLEKSEITIRYVVQTDQEDAPVTPETSFSDKLTQFGCIALIILGVFTVIVGLITILQWLV